MNSSRTDGSRTSWIRSRSPETISNRSSSLAPTTNAPIASSASQVGACACRIPVRSSTRRSNANCVGQVLRFVGPVRLVAGVELGPNRGTPVVVVHVDDLVGTPAHDQPRDHVQVADDGADRRAVGRVDRVAEREIRPVPQARHVEQQGVGHRRRGRIERVTPSSVAGVPVTRVIGPQSPHADGPPTARDGPTARSGRPSVPHVGLRHRDLSLGRGVRDPRDPARAGTLHRVDDAVRLRVTSRPRCGSGRSSASWPGSPCGPGGRSPRPGAKGARGRARRDRAHGRCVTGGSLRVGSVGG